ncbi:peroxisome proliferator-activated receptor gamma coactivator-related protein 1 isoform X1 [Xenopus laevis]|uniref:Peroxisome proliferator-activated receptor gamma coactivator-related protein 1 isoform X1 n=1 Tax=Xenopus laevis TaxID=8355 RepID=A0A8J0TFB3_XENLA|nr:peroxisome proliferator-activated receptor gamma coactivator-related protein 1 isoform X1 [Xenopus laevis]
MAARWGVGEETLTIGGMELFTAGGPLQCNVLEDHESCSGLSDLSLDAGGFLGTFQGYVDHSIISIIDDTGALAENKGHFDEENELSLLNALTEILDNADDENMSPFDTIPDTELLVSPKDKENATLQRFLSLSRTPTDRAVSPLDEQRGINGKFDTSGQNWELFTENISSTPKRHNRQRNTRGCLTRRLKSELTQQRSDGEDEEFPSPEKNFEKDSTAVDFESEFAVNSVNRENVFEEEVLMKRIPCIINTENVALNDLVKYMHPYCLPSIAACMDPKESEIEDNLNEGIFLEIVANGKCIKLPVVIEPAEEMESEGLEEKVCLSGGKNSDVEMQQSSEEQCGSLQDSDQHLVKSTDECTQSVQEPILLDCKEILPILSSQGEEPTLEPQQKDIVENEPKFEPSSENNGLSQTIFKQCNDFGTKGNELAESGPIKKDNEPEACVKEHAAQKGKKSDKVCHGSQKSKLKTKKKTVECKQQDVVEKMTLPNNQPPVCVNNPVVQESDFLIKQLEQVKMETRLELRSSKMVRAKARSRQNMDNSNASVKKLHNGKTKKIEKPVAIENEQAKKSSENTASEKDLAQNNVEMVCEQAEGKSDKHIEGNTVLDDKTVHQQEDEGKDFLPNIQCKESLDLDEKSTMKGEVENDPNALQMSKPKSLSLSEYRMRMQHRKPNAEQRDNESKWPSIPEPPTELAEIPCLVVPGKEEVSLKPSKVKPLEEKPRAEEPSGLEISSSSVSATSSQPVLISEALQPKQPDMQAQTVAMDIAPFSVTSQPNVPPPPFYTPAWPSVPLQPPYYPSIPPPNAVTFANGVPHDPLHTLPMPPPPVMAWPPFPPPPFAMGPVPSPDMPLLGAGLPPPPLPFWPHLPMQQGLPERGPPSLSTDGTTAMPPVAFSDVNKNIDSHLSKETYVAPVKHHSQNNSAVSSQKRKKSDNSGLISKDRNTNDVAKPPKEFIKQNTVPLKQSETRTSKLPAESHSDLRKLDLSKSAGSAAKMLETMPAEPKKVNLQDPNIKFANPVVLKIMEILKKAQKLGFQINPQQPLQSGSSKSGTLLPCPLKPIQKPCKEQGKVNPKRLTKSLDKDPILENQPKGEPIKIASDMQKQGKVESSQVPSIHPVQQKISIDATPGDTRADGNIKITSAVANDPQAPVENFTCEEGIEATDLTSLLEQFEKSEANNEERHTQSPELKVAVGNSGFERPMEKKVLDRLLAPELASTAGLTPPATPPHQMWKPAIASSLTGKAKPLHGNFQDRACTSPLKAAKLIEAKPLPQCKLRNKSTVIAPVYAQPPIHVASGDHDYCILATGKCPVAASSALTQSEPETVNITQPSRWNVKHHQNITIKPIVPFNKRVQNKLCPNQATTLEVCNQSIPCGTNKSVPSHSNSQKNTNDPLDHRTNVVESVAEKHPGSVLMSPDASPCRSEDWETRTSVRREDTAFSRRSLRCYRRYRSSPSPQKSSRSRSCSADSSCSSSSSSSHSRSPPSKRQRIYRSRSRHRSRSSSRSRYHGSSSRSWSSSSSYSSRSCSPSSSCSGSRSRSPCRRRYRSRSRRCESRESCNRQKIQHKEQAIEERRVVYIGKINSLMTRTELKSRFSVFGEIEECTIHFREEGDNYGFVTYRYTCEAFAAIENGHKLRLPDELPFDLCFGGRRQFCKSSYADLDSNKDDFDPAPIRSKFESLDFDTLLKQAQKNIRR